MLGCIWKKIVPCQGKPQYKILYQRAKIPRLKVPTINSILKFIFHCCTANILNSTYFDAVTNYYLCSCAVYPSTFSSFLLFLFISLTNFDHCRLDCMLPGHCLVYFHRTILKHAVVYLSRTVACTINMLVQQALSTSSNVHSTMNFCPDQTSQESIKCAKAKKYVRSYYLIYMLW